MQVVASFATVCVAPSKNYEYIHEWVYKSINIGILELEFSLA